ncbi:NirD/YgiW/YdeI family stress tolerance protein [Klebsiella michiganensis]|nr:NirD/YgiW/YdeI family stress tolerance protein [Klebsiella michiganensis]MDL4455004.1 NirD/YgiW/YdeI family stress tolerance protein [Klebsiella michiganensis]
MQLEGQITRRLGHERYEFRDASGTVVLDIDDKVWHGVTVSAERPGPHRRGNRQGVAHDRDRCAPCTGGEVNTGGGGDPLSAAED